ncbi:putative beta-phosphoglucomutase [Galbibacter marinus]|uniref:Putative beta-phosphoglucomutase n=1 Tax=Galbibacter marinus TaxID=555500 RepID=K2PRU0_9FLAO|nr:beta-phosphoglucomutase [Galbibacter marinus]EKF54224.1 putative beta-phosphoglucomutase [Galbibacter marinus]
MKQQKGFIFDLDGVIVDTAKFHFLAWRKLGENFNFQLSEQQNEQLKGVSRIDSLNKILNWAGVEISPQEFDRLASEKNEDYLEYVAQMTPDDILPGVKSTIEKLKSANYPIALGSASKNAPGILRKVGLFDLFDAIVDGNSVSKAKPDPEVFLQAASQLEVAPKDCIVFEDAYAGITAANNAGMTSIALGDAEVLHHADYVFNTFNEITYDFLTQLQSK